MTGQGTAKSDASTSSLPSCPLADPFSCRSRICAGIAITEAAEKGKELDDADVPIDTSLDGDLHNLERKKDRTLYLLAKKDRKEHAWQFRKS